MKNIFLDTNILLDYLTERQPFFFDADAIFNLGDKGNIKLYCSALSFSTVFYVLRKFQPSAELFQTLSDLTLASTITGVDSIVVKAALDSGFKDLEDAIQYFSAYYFGGIDSIITRNPQDFKDAKIPVFKPAEFLALIQKQ